MAVKHYNMQRTGTPKKSPIRQKATPSKSPGKKEGLSDTQIEDKLKRNREKLTHTLDTYSMLIRSNTPIRCLEHNSVVSIFCETEGRLLCTNCVFGRNDHKFHRISPIDKSHERIRDSLQRLQPVVEKEMGTLDHIKEIVLINLEQEVVDLEKGL
jgi:hypothetical protein